jgi:hypothetical protein
MEDVRTLHEGFFKARMIFFDNSVLSFREYVNSNFEPIERYTYSFHYFKNEQLIFRYDNTPHFPQLKTFPHHKHLSDGTVIESDYPELKNVLNEIETILIQ